jgi:hypothetical protein
MKYLLFCLLYSTASIAQSGTTYPPVAKLRSTLLQLIESKKNAFQDIKGAALNKKGTTQYYEATLHFVPNDTPKVAEDTNPLQAYYLDFLNKGLEEELSKTAFKEWQRLIIESLPGYSISMSKQYPDLESRDFTSPDGSIKLTLYRNTDKIKWQISVAMINANLNELLAAVEKKKTPPPVKPVSKDPPVKVPSEEQKIMQQTIAKVLKDRLNGFRNFKGGAISNTGKFVVKGTDYPYAEDLVEYIEEAKNGAVTYTVMISGDAEANDALAAYREVLTAGQHSEGYKYNPEETGGKTRTCSISYKGAVISKCTFKEDGESETVILIYGRKNVH